MLSRITKRTWPQEIVYDSISREFPNRWISNARFDRGFKDIRGNNVNIIDEMKTKTELKGLALSAHDEEPFNASQLVDD